MAYFLKMLFKNHGPINFPIAASYAKLIAFGASIDAARKKKIQIGLGELIYWSNDWLGPDFEAKEEKRSVVLYDLRNEQQWINQPVQTFYDALMKQSYLSVYLRKLKKNELAIVEKMAKGFSREIEAFINEQGINDGGKSSDFDSAGILWNLWLKANETLNQAI